MQNLFRTYHSIVEHFFVCPFDLIIIRYRYDLSLQFIHRYDLLIEATGASVLPNIIIIIALSQSTQSQINEKWN